MSNWAAGLPPAVGLEGADGKEGREALPESVWMCTHGGVHMAAEGHREGAEGAGPGDLMWVLALPSKRQWP